MTESGWLQRELDEAAADVKNGPSWMKRHELLGVHSIVYENNETIFVVYDDYDQADDDDATEIDEPYLDA